tara:strand:+ start:810 stop:2081 length:1272 start_codon:yes stop_codon:yes gene_type:complete
MIKNKINDYRICEKRIGKGSFSTIYKCYDKNNNPFAIKNINIDKPKDIEIIKNEFNIMRKLSHINIIKVYELIIDDNLNNINLILEYFENGDLSKYLNGSLLTECYANNFSIQIKNGLEYLMSKDILHRDIKPQNILVSKNNILKITDFGLSKYISSNELMATICGSPLYMAPEILKHKQYTVKSDIWSFGIIIYEMIYGFIPFKSDNIYNLIKKIDNCNILFKKTNITPECIDLIISMLQKNPDKRIDWKELFEHKWFNNNQQLNQENSLLEIPIDSINIPIFKNFNPISSFKYKSITDKIDESLEFNFDLKESTYNSVNSIYLSAESEMDIDIEMEMDIEMDIEMEMENNFVKKSNPININNNKKNNDENLISSFVLVSKESTYNINCNEGSHKSKLKEYLYNSITFVKQSCDYINKSSSL